MNQYEIPAIIEDELPHIYQELKHTGQFGDAVQLIRMLTGFVGNLLSMHNIGGALNCIRMIDRIYNRGNTVIKNAVENVFIFSFSTFQQKCTGKEWSVLRSKTPITLYSLYIQQLYRSGI